MDQHYTSLSADTRDHRQPDTRLGADDGLDLRGLVFGIWRRKSMIAFVIVASVVTCVLFLSTATRKYSSEARILIEDRESVFTRASSSDRQTLAPDALTIQSEVQVLRSRDLALRVAESLGLEKSGEFNPASDGPSLSTQFMMMIGLASGQTTLSMREKVLDSYYSKLNVVPIPDSRVIAVSFSSVNPERAAAVANTIARVYVNSTQEAKFENARRATEWLARQIETLRGRVADSEGAVEELRAKSGLFDGAVTTLSKQALSELNSQISAAAAARSAAEARSKAIRRLLSSNAAVDSAPEVLNSPLIQRLREQQAILQRRIDDLAISYLPNHPTMKRLYAERTGLDKQIRNEAVKILKGLENQASVAGAREKGLRDNLIALKTKTALSNQDEVRIKALEREAAANRRLLDTFLDRFREASTRDDVTSLPPAARIISTAQIRSTPTFPKTGPILLLTLVGSTVLGLVLAFIAEMFSTPVRGSRVTGRHAVMPDAPVRDVTMEPAGPAGRPATSLSGTFGLQHNVPPVDMPLAPEIDFEKAIQSLRASLVAASGRVHSNRILITSIGLEPDNAVVASALAHALAGTGERVLMIDADFHNASVARFMGVQARTGLAELLMGDASFKDVVAEDPASGVQILAAGHSLDRARALLRSPRMERVVDELAKAYTYVIVVAPSIVVSNDGSYLARTAKLAVLLRDESRGQAASADGATQALLSCGCDAVMPVDTVVSTTGLSIKAGSLVTRLGVAA